MVADAVDDIDYTGGETLLELVDELKERGIVFAIAEVGPDVWRELNRFGVTRRIRKDRVLETLEDARGGLSRLIATGLPSTRRATAGTRLQRRRADAHRA